jgi:hypothetical protein
MDIRYGRKRRGIVHELNKKLSDWLDSIDDEELRNVVAKDTIVTGGAIASMLLGERVNDFDVYFRTKSTARSVAEYYVKKFNEIKPSSDYAPEVREETRKNAKGEMEDRVIIWLQSAGVASEEQSGYAYFETLDESATAEFVESLVEKDDEPATQPYRPVFLSENAITLSDKVQLVTRFYGEPDKIHDNYDFVHATCYYDYGTRELVLPAEALECLLSRTLVYRGSLYPVASIFRMKKFLDRGWRITAGQQLKIMWQISELDLRDYSVLREQLTGVDMAYMWQLIEALHNTDPEKISSTYVSEIIDRIFG